MNERNNKQNERRVYTKEFKLDAVELTNKTDKKAGIPMSRRRIIAFHSKTKNSSQNHF